MKSSKGVYTFLFTLTTINVVLGFLNMKGCFTSTMGGNSSYSDILIAITGFLAAFSAISIYSIFNAHVDREKERIDKIKMEAEESLKKTEDLLDYIKNDELNFYRMKVLMDLTSGYSTINKKREAIQYFTQKPPETNDTKMFICNFFKSLDINQKKEKYYRELEKLLTDWGMISMVVKSKKVQPV